MNKDQYQKWTEFREKKSNSISYEEFEFLCQVHSELFNHKFYKPCTCRPKEINKWIKDINEKYAEIDPNEFE
jgi:hypothetical protein